MASTLGVHARTLFLDGMEGTTAGYPLIYGGGDSNCSYTVTNQPSPFNVPCLGANTKSGVFVDKSTTVNPVLSSNHLGDTSTTNEVHVAFDFRPLAANPFAFVVGHGSGAPYHFILTLNGALAVSGRPVPNVTLNPSSWYHVDILLRPTASPAAQRTYDVTVTQDTGGVRKSGTLTGIPQGNAEMITTFSCFDPTWNPASIGSIQVDNIIVETLPRALDLRYGYLPSAHVIRYLLTGMPPSDASGWDIKLTRASDGKQLAHHAGNFPIRDANGFNMKIPALTDGEYKLQVWLTGSNMNQQVIERTFPHVTYPWATSPLGMEDVLVPPFTAITVNKSKRTVDTILRTHTMSDAGLWSQVKSMNVDLLTGPMRLEVVSGGQTYAATGKGVSFSKRTATRVTGKATWSAGPIQKATTEFDYDYDGLMKVTLTLPPTTETVDSLRLIIPLKDTEVKYMHEVTDMLRGHPSQSVPVGNGKIWDSSHAWRANLPAPFVPYVWVGGAERGIAWCAENDRDWIVQPTDGVIELDRSSGELQLIVKFITVPSKLTRPRTIRFGLQATPAKPMPTQPVNWRRWVHGFSSAPDVVQFEIMGSGYSWGQPVNCIQFYPAFKNFSIYDEFVKSRELGVNSGTAFVEQWLKQYPADWPTNAPTTYRGELNWGLDFMRTRTKSTLKTNVVTDSMEDAPLRPLVLTGAGSYTKTTNNVSPFLSATFKTNTTSGLLVAKNVRLETTGFGFSTGEWVNVQFDLRPVTGNYRQWQFGDVQIHGNSFAVRNGRKLATIPNIPVVAGNWYHIGIIYSPATIGTFDITITRQDTTGKRTYGTLYGVRRQDAAPIDSFRIATRGQGEIQIDNVLVRAARRYWVIPYTNARGINWADTLDHTGEVGTYLDEWSMVDIADPRWEDEIKGTHSEWRLLRENATADNYFSPANGHGLFQSVWYDVDPVESMASMMLYYHRKMWENGMADGIYWDDVFLKANYNPVSGPGYIGDDGQLHAGVNLYAFRNLAKRAAVLQHTMGMRPLLVPHMTNTRITPILSFATMNLTLEMGDSKLDMQDRFELDKDLGRVFVEVTGFQDGNVGLVLDLFRAVEGSAPREHLLRSAMAVALTHEFKVSAYDGIYFVVSDKLATWGYGQPDCTVYRYWEGPHPVTTTGATVKTLTLKRPGKAYIILGSFGDGGDANFTIDAATLGLPAGYKVFDDETGAELTATGPNQYRIKIIKHEFNLVRIQ